MVFAVTLIRENLDRLFFDYGNGKNRKAIRLSNVVMPEK